MATTWYKYKVLCNTETDNSGAPGIWVTKITEIENDTLTVCPNNEEHTIVPGSSMFVDKVESNEVIIVEETVKTGGAYAAHGVPFDAPGTETNGGQPLSTQNAFIHGIPMSILSGIFNSSSDADGDIINIFVLPQNATTVGTTTADVADGDLVLNVDSNVIAMVEPDHVAQITITEMATGRTSDKVRVMSLDYQASTITVEYPINIEDGNPLEAANVCLVSLDTNIIGQMIAPNTVNNRWIYLATPVWDALKVGRWINLFMHNQARSELRKIIEVDVVNSRVKIQEPFTVALNPADSAVYIQLTIKMIDSWELENNEKIHIGNSTIGGAYINSAVIVFEYIRTKEGTVRARPKYELLY